MKTQIKYTSLLVIALAATSCATNYISKGDKHYQQLEYADAVKDYSKAYSLEKDNEDYTYYGRFARSHNKLNDYYKAEKYYEVGYEERILTQQGMKEYIGVLISNKKKDKATEVLERYLKLYPQDDQIQNLSQAVDSILLDTPMYRYAIHEEKKLNKNGSSNYSPTYYKNNSLIFVTERNLVGNKTNKWNNKPYHDLYMANIDRNELGKASLEASLDVINTKFHEGPATYSEFHDALFFTQTNLSDKGEQVSGDLAVENQLMWSKAYPGLNKWSTPQKVWFNSDNYSIGHPTISKDGQTLIFASTMKGGNGNSDLFKSEFKNEKWTKPENLGSVINTSGDEVFPFLHETKSSKRLYFSSNGHQTLGDLDIFYIDYKNNKWSKVKRMEAPINSSRDDFGFIMADNGKTGYFSTNVQSGDYTVDKIFSYEVIETNYFLKGHVISSTNGDTLRNASVWAFDPESRINVSTTTDEHGAFKLALPYDKDIVIEASAPSYFSKSKIVSTDVKNYKYNDSSYIALRLPAIEVSKNYRLNDIFYAFDKSNIRYDASKDLDALITLMNVNKSMSVELQSHTDCRGDNDYNMKLSQRRAKSAKKYMVKRGIKGSRILTKGMGETVLFNQCDCENTASDKCSDDEHEMNRRTEFKVLKK